ncbi:MAG: hypothetical protein R3D85_14200 [Paracoccaceae bacterium]
MRLACGADLDRVQHLGCVKAMRGDGIVDQSGGVDAAGRGGAVQHPAADAAQSEKIEAASACPSQGRAAAAA